MDKLLVLGALGIYALYKIVGDTPPLDVPGVTVWSESDLKEAETKLKAINIKVIMLGRFSSAPNPNTLLQANVFNPHSLTLIYDLATSVFAFSDRPKQFFRAAGNEWQHDITLETYVNAK